LGKNESETRKVKAAKRKSWMLEIGGRKNIPEHRAVP
jgi:hypothetical protein